MRMQQMQRTTWMGSALFYFFLKEPAMRVKYFVLILILPALLVACQGQPISTALPPQVTASISGVEVKQVDPDTSQEIRQRMGIFLSSNPYTQFKSVGQLLLYLVSSGEFGQAEISLDNGKTSQADVLYAYALMRSQRVLVAPVMIGLQLPDGTYLYFSQNYAFQSDGGILSIGLDRQAALQDAGERLQKGHIFRLLAYGMATPQGLDWEKCPSVAFYPPAICLIGELVEQLYPGQTKSFILRLSDGFPDGWLLTGWVFQEFAPEELVRGTSIDIPLP
jgi:hypothetical protein